MRWSGTGDYAGLLRRFLLKKEEARMRLTMNDWCGVDRGMKAKPGLAFGLCLLWMALVSVAGGQAVTTTTVQGTVYLANGQVGSGTLVLSWPAFTTASGQQVAADSMTLSIGADGFVSVNLTPNLGATPAGLYYTAVYYLRDGTTTTQYWVVPAAAQASLGQVQAQLMPAAQAVQAVSKAYVDQTMAELEGSLLTASGGNLTGPLILNGDPTQALQAADKHYVDTTFSEAVPIAGGNMTGALQTPTVNGVQSPLAGSAQTTLQAAVNAAGANGAIEIPPGYAGHDTFGNPNGVYVKDLRPNTAQQQERSVKEFGAVCDGVTDDTVALQAALTYANAHGIALTIPQGTCKTQTLNWHGESIGGLGKQVSALMGYPGQDVLASAADSSTLLAYTRIHDLTIYVDQSMDVSCSSAQGRAAAGQCATGRPMEQNSIFSAGGNGLSGTAGTGPAWSVGNCAIAMPATTGAGGNGLRVAEIENVEIAATGTDPMAAQYPGAHSTHTCGLYLGQWPQWSEFRNIDIRGLNTGIALPALPGAVPAGLNSDSNRWENITISATHAFTATAGSNNVLDNVVAMAANSAATGEAPTGLVLDLSGTAQGWTVRNAVVLPTWNAVQPQLTVAAAGGAVTSVTVGAEHGLGLDPYGTQVPLKFSGSCTAQALASVTSNGSVGAVSVQQGGVGCSGTTTASLNVAGSWDTAAPVNLIGGQNMTFFAGNLLKGNGGYTVWNAANSQNNGTGLGGGGGNLPGGGTYAALVANSSLGSALPVDQFAGADFGAKLQACLGALSTTYGGTCDARDFSGNQSMGSNVTVSTANSTVLLPCATIATSNQIVISAGSRNVSLRGCALRGGSTASGSEGGTAFLYSGAGAMVQVGDPGYALDTAGFHMDNVVINTTASTSAAATGLIAYRTQELSLEGLYFLGNANQTGMTLDGTGNYTGGSFYGDQFSGFETAINAIGHQAANAATTDWLNASTFVRMHIDCPMSAGSPVAGTIGINLQQGDGNTFTGGDVEGCGTALHLGANAQNNTIVGLRNENSTNQVVADPGSSYNNWMTGGTMFTGQLTDNGTRNSFLDTFHRTFNGMNGDWYGSQKDATVTNHYRLGIGKGNERGLMNEIQTDYGYRWLEGYTDATAGEQFYQVQDLLNNVNRLSIGQYNNGQSSSNNQTVINAAGTGAVVLNGSSSAGTGGVIFGSGGATSSTVATIDNLGDGQLNGTLLVGGTSQSTGTMTVRNNADAEVDYYLWPGLSASQKGSFTYKDWNGNSQWYMVKDASNNWALNSAPGGLDSFKAYQSSNSGDTYVNASNSSGVVRVNYESGSGAGFNIYGGNSGALYASFTGATAIKFPGLAASSGHNCMQIDNSGYITNTGSACGSGGSGSVGSANGGQIAYYTANGTSIGGMNQVPMSAGGTGASTAAGALASLGAQPAIAGMTSDGANGVQVSANGSFGGTVSALSVLPQQIGSVFYADGFPLSCTVAWNTTAGTTASTSYTTQLDCAVATAEAWINTNHLGAVLELGTGTYYTNVGITLPSNIWSVTLSIEGKSTSMWGFNSKVANTIIYQQGNINANANSAVIYQPDAVVAGNWPSFFIRNVSIIALSNAKACMNIFGFAKSTFEHISCEHANDGTAIDHLVAFSDPNDTSGSGGTGWGGYSYGYESNFKDFFISMYNQGGWSGTNDTVATTVTGGSLTALAVSGTASYYSGVPSVFFLGHGTSSNVPCTTMPTATVTLSGGTSGTITGYTITGNGAGTCTGVLDAQIQFTSNVSYGFRDDWVSDSTLDDIRIAGPFLVAGARTGSNKYYDMHSYGMQIDYEDHGASQFFGGECDGPWQYCINELGAGTTFNGMSFYYGQGGKGSSFAYLSPAAIDTKFFGISCPNKQVWGDFHLFSTSTGVMDAGAASPSGLDAFGMTNCSTTAATPTSGPMSYASTPFQQLAMGINNPTNANAAGSFPLQLLSWQGGQQESVTIKTNTDANTYDQLGFYWQNSSHAPNGEGLGFVNTTPATATNNYNPPEILLTGNYWNGSSSAQVQYSLQGVVGTGTNPSSMLAFGYSGAGQPSVSFPITESGSNLYSLIMSGAFTASRTVTFPDVNVNMMVGQVAKANLAGQTASIGATTLVSSALAGVYILDAEAIVTTAASTSSTLPNCGVTFTDADTSVGLYEQASATSTGNVVGTTQSQGSYRFNAKAGTAISYSCGSYASSGATAMQYAVHVRLEYLGQ